MAEDRRVFRIGKQDVEGDLYNVAGNLILEQFEKRLPPLHQLPPDVADFTGRQDDLKMTADFLQSVAEGSGTVPTILIISGMGGVGKSALAIHAAHSSKDLFDEQLYVDLRGSGGTGSEPLAPSDVLWSFLSSLGVDPGSIPEDIASRAGLFRSLLAEKGALLFLDNAHDEKQVRPLLPGNKRCAVLITSRPALSALEGALPIRLGLMPYEEALDLLAKTAVDGRVRAEADSARRIVELCGRLPLAIRIAGGKIRDKEHWTLVKYADLLEDERKRLERLHLGDLDVRASFELSYEELDEIEARIFRLLSLLPGQDFEPGVVGAMLEIDEESAFEATEKLVDLRLIEPSSEGRYKFHDLMHLFAREKIEAEKTAEEIEAARLRAVRWYVERSGFMDKLLRAETRHKIAQDLAVQEGKEPDKLSRSLFSEALGWFEREDANLLESVRWAHEAGSWEEAYMLAGNLVSFQDLRSMWAEWVDTHKLALEAAQRAGNRQAEGQILKNMGTVYCQQGDWDDAIKMYEDSLKVFHELEDWHSKGLVLMNIGTVYSGRGRWNDAIKMYKEALKVFRDRGDLHNEGLALMNMGSDYLELGHIEGAITVYDKALRVFRDMGDKHREGQTLMGVGNFCRLQGRWDDAIKVYEDSVDIFRDLGDKFTEGQTLTNMGIVYSQQGRWDDAIKVYDKALKVFRDLNYRQGEGTTLMDIGNIYLQQKRWDDAIKMFEASLKVYRDIGDCHGMGLTLYNLAIVYSHQGRLNEAIDVFDESLEVFRDLGDRQREGQTLMNMGIVYNMKGLKEKTVTCWKEALQKLQSDSPEQKMVEGWLASLRTS
ncbi:MAG TPA: tetratricopeptide repeat protein [Methanothrix soehngenii]|nr:tetratricopeptide repeat protein [Methanothrix soehngenii]